MAGITLSIRLRRATLELNDSPEFRAHVEAVHFEYPGQVDARVSVRSVQAIVKRNARQGSYSARG
ncbi:MAG: hypothetical protein O7G86_18015 [Gammaproteobacteria bacterium]|nr:hypothetical protein [Gammaproteobacteria bacterium]